MTRSDQDPDTSDTPKGGYTATRRALIAAAAAVAGALATGKAHAMARPPSNWGKRGSHCFLSGMHIRTPKGEVEVNDLMVGELVDTISGDAKPIKWIGRRRFERARGERWPTKVLPVKVARSALGPLTPHTDLFLSPAHAVYVDGMLVPVGNLVNGCSIVRCSWFDADIIDYYHIELFTHDVVFAEGAPAETLLAARDGAFDNWVNDRGIDPGVIVDPSQSYAPRVRSFGRREEMRSRLRSACAPWIDRRQPVDVIWDRLAERAETRIAA